MNLTDIYANGTAQQLWQAWSEKQRTHFLIDHADMFIEVMEKDFNTSAEEFAKMDFPKLPNSIRKEVIIHHAMGIYKEGGDIGGSMAKGGHVKGSFKSGILKEIKQAVKNKTTWNLYEKYEDDNYHSENVVLLAYSVGDESDKENAVSIWDNHQKSTSGISDDDYEKRQEINKRLWSKFVDNAKINEKIKMNEGGTINKIKMIDPKLSPAKQKLVIKIDKIKKAMADIKSESIRKAMQKKIDKLQAAVDYNPSVKQRVAQGTGRFFIDIPSTDKKKLYKALWVAGIKPKMHTLNGSTKVIFTNAGNMQKGYGIYAALLSNMGKPVPELNKIKGKL